MKKVHKSKFVEQNHNNDFSERFPIYMPSTCDLCCCRSCTGFECPWLDKYDKYKSSGNKDYSKRCEVCKNRKFKRIYDCDFYTYYRRNKFFLPRKFKRPKTKLDSLNDKLSFVIKLLEREDEM